MNREEALVFVKYANQFRLDNIEVIKAYSEGKEIEYRDVNWTKWKAIPNSEEVFFMWDLEYRVKTEPTKKVKVGLRDDECTPILLAWTEDWADKAERQDNFIKWITDWEEY